MDKRIEDLNKIFNGDFSEWMMYRLPEYLNERFDEWVINPLDKNSVEVFISGYDEPAYWEVEDDIFDETMFIAFDLLKFFGVDVEVGDLPIELVVDFALESIYVHPTAQMGDEPLDDDKLLTNKDYLTT